MFVDPVRECSEIRRQLPNDGLRPAFQSIVLPPQSRILPILVPAALRPTQAAPAAHCGVCHKRILAVPCRIRTLQSRPLPVRSRLRPFAAFKMRVHNEPDRRASLQVLRKCLRTEFGKHDDSADFPVIRVPCPCNLLRDAGDGPRRSFDRDRQARTRLPARASMRDACWHCLRSKLPRGNCRFAPLCPQGSPVCVHKSPEWSRCSRVPPRTRHRFRSA